MSRRYSSNRRYDDSGSGSYSGSSGSEGVPPSYHSRSRRISSRDIEEGPGFHSRRHGHYADPLDDRRDSSEESSGAEGRYDRRGSERHSRRVLLAHSLEHPDDRSAGVPAPAPTGVPEAAAPATSKKSGGGGKKVIIGLFALLLVGGGLFWANSAGMFGNKDDASTEAVASDAELVSNNSPLDGSSADASADPASPAASGASASSGSPSILPASGSSSPSAAAATASPSGGASTPISGESPLKGTLSFRRACYPSNFTGEGCFQFVPGTNAGQPEQSGVQSTGGPFTWVGSASGGSNMVRVSTDGKSVGWNLDASDASDIKAVKLQTAATYPVGTVWLLDVLRMPFGCGVWPSFWSWGEGNWPEGGAIASLENYGLGDLSSHVFHSLTTKDNTCQLPAANSGLFAGTIVTGQESCAADPPGKMAYGGCSIMNPSDKSYSKTLADNGGGVVATAFVEKGIFVWFFERGSVPDGIENSPDISKWGKPSAAWPNEGCSIQQNFRDQRVVLSTEICNKKSDEHWKTKDKCLDLAQSCSQFVANPASVGAEKIAKNFQDNGIFEVKYFKVFNYAAPGQQAAGQQGNGQQQQGTGQQQGQGNGQQSNTVVPVAQTTNAGNNGQPQNTASANNNYGGYNNY